LTHLLALILIWEADGMDFEQLRQMVRLGEHAAVMLYLIDEVERMQRKPVEDDFRTAATSKEVCLCSYKPFPHPRLPAHPDEPQRVVIADGVAYIE
jgi:hypothetical protein